MRAARPLVAQLQEPRLRPLGPLALVSPVPGLQPAELPQAVS